MCKYEWTPRADKEKIAEENAMPVFTLSLSVVVFSLFDFILSYPDKSRAHGPVLRDGI